MKKEGLFCLLLVCIGFVSCKNEEKRKEKLEAKKPISVDCYQALYEKDTVDLVINTLKDGKISGKMVMKFVEGSTNTGEIKGEFHGDTLFADYSFYQGKDSVKVFKNPIAFLKKEEQLMMGDGKIEIYLGKSYFSKETPIEFEKVKYKFQKVDCAQ